MVTPYLIIGHFHHDIAMYGCKFFPSATMHRKYVAMNSALTSPFYQFCIVCVVIGRLFPLSLLLPQM